MYKIHHKWNHDFPKLARASGFKFFDIDSNCQTLDFRKIGQLDMDAIKADSNFEQLAQLIPHVAEAPIATLINSRILDPALVKYFVAAQLIVQYLTFCLQCLDQAVSELHQTICELETEKQTTAAVVRRQKDELNHLQRKVSRLQAGNKRKRADDEVEVEASVKDLNLINTIKLELEMKHLKERLSNAEKELHERRIETWPPVPVVVTTPVPSPRKSTCSCACRNETALKTVQEVGIQSNLDEPKETDDKIVDLREMMERLVDDQHQAGSREVELFTQKFEHLESLVTNLTQNLDTMKTKINAKQNTHKWEPLDDQHLAGGREVELFTQKFDHLENLVTNLSQNLETLKSKADGVGEEVATNQLLKTKMSEIERSQELGQQKLLELDSEYGEKLGDIRLELGKIAQYLADEQKPPNNEMKAVQVMVHSAPREESVSESPSSSEEDQSGEPAKSPELPETASNLIEKIDLRALTENLFKSRLKSLGVSSKANAVPTFFFERIQQRLADRRIKQRQAHATFMKVRKQLSTEANERASRPKTTNNQHDKVQQVMAQEVMTPRSLSEESMGVEKQVATKRQIMLDDTVENEVEYGVEETAKQLKKKVLFADSTGAEQLAVRLEDILDSDDIGSDLDFATPY